MNDDDSGDEAEARHLLAKRREQAKYDAVRGDSDMCGGQAVADYPFIRGKVDTDVRTSPIGLLDATKRVLAERLADDATLSTYTSLARALTGFRAAVEARLPKTRRGRPGYAEDDTPQTIEQATEINEDALRYYGIPAGALATSAECGDGVRYQSDSDESDSDDE